MRNKNIFWIGLVAVVLVICGVAAIAGIGAAVTSEKGQVCLSKHMDNLIGCFFAPPVALTVKASGSVDEVRILRAEDDHVMGRVVTNGQDVADTIPLSTAYKYYLVVTKGDQTRTGRPQGFDTMQGSEVMEVFTIDRWEGGLSR